MTEKTALRRNKPSLPVQYLLARGLLSGEGLDYGCGYGYDASYLDIDAYDTYYQPKWPEKQYDYILCNYVLNVIERKDDRLTVLRKINTLLKPDGILYLSVTCDRHKLNGETLIGTWQGYIEFDFEVLNQGRHGFTLYRITKEDLERFLNEN